MFVNGYRLDLLLNKIIITAAIDGMSVESGDGCVTSEPTIITGSLVTPGRLKLIFLVIYFL